MENIWHKNNRNGFTLIEIIMAISLLSFGIVLVYSSFLTMVVLTYDISSRFTAAYLAQEGLEIVRNIRDNNVIAAKTWSAGLLPSFCSTGCIADYKTEAASGLEPYSDVFLALDTGGFYSYDKLGKPTIFKRKITINRIQGTSDALFVDVLVTWLDKGQTFSFNTGEYLYNWK